MATPELLEALRRLANEDEGAAPPLDKSTPVLEPGPDSPYRMPKTVFEVADTSRVPGLTVDQQAKLQDKLNEDPKQLTPGVPQPSPMRSGNPADSSLVKAYLARMSRKDAPDPEVQDALAQTKSLRMAKALFGNSGPGTNAQVAMGLAGISPPAQRPSPIDENAPLNDLMSARKATRDSREADLKDIDQAAQVMQRSAQAGRLSVDPNDPNSLAYLRYLLGLEEHNRKLREGVVHDLQGQERAGTQQRVADARQESADTNKTRLGLDIGKHNEARQAGVGGVGGDTSNMDIHDKRTAGEVVSAQRSLESTLDELKSLKDKYSGYGSIPKTEKDRIQKTLYGLMSPLVSTATGQGRFTLAHQHLASEIMGSPNGWVDRVAGALDPEAIDAQLEELRKISREEANNRLYSLPGGRNLHVAKPGEAPAPARVFDPGTNSYVEKPSRTVVKKFVNRAAGKTKLVYSDGTEEVQDGIQ